MSYQVCFTDKFKTMLKELQKNGGEAQQAAKKAQIALSEAQIDGEIKSVPRSHHGETRLPNVEKYQLSDSYRLIVQLIDGVNKVRVFLFAGKHDDSENWLNSNRDYRYVVNGRDSIVKAVLISDRHTAGTRGFDLESSDEDLRKPLLGVMKESEIKRLISDDEKRKYVCQITSEDWENRSASILDKVLEMFSETLADLILNLFDVAHENQKDKLQQMNMLVAKYEGLAKITDGADLAKALHNSVNAESFIEYETEMGDFWDAHPNADWDDWMLFLNPKQKEWSKKELNGPARLCGVSGSGKTCVMLHRARFLAKKHPTQSIAILTLTLSMKNLLDSLLNRLCGAERAYIETFTIESFIKNSLVEKNHPTGLRGISKIVKIDDSDCKNLVENAVRRIFSSSEFERSPWLEMDEKQKYHFVVDEFSYVRTRLTPDKYDDYCLPDFKRIGRGVPLQESLRKVVLDSLKKFDEDLNRLHWVDHEAMSHMAIQYMDRNLYKKYRAIMIDEVQDLSQNDLRAIGMMKNVDDILLKDAPNGLFLVGDGAQTIYKNGFSLRKIGINVIGRSFAFKKNYRNTKEILEAAYALIQNFDCSNLDEEERVKPMSPEYANQCGTKPKILKFYNKQKEIECVTKKIQFLINNGEIAGNICVIGLTKAYRDDFSKKLRMLGISSAEIKDNVQVGNEVVKISTIESAKGHEFSTVFIVGLASPIGKEYGKDVLTLKASRLYVAMTRACNNLILSYSMSSGYAASPLLMYVEDFCNTEECR